MDTEDRVNINTEQMNSNSENQSNLQNTSIEQGNSIKQELEDINEINLNQSEKNVTLKEPVEILSVELMTPGTELQNMESVKVIESDKQVEHNKTIVDASMEITTVEEESVATIKIEQIPEFQEKEDAMANESMETAKEAEDNEMADINMESETVVDTTTITNINDFSKQSSTILSGIENIQSSVETTSSNIESISNDAPTTIPSGLSLLAQYDSDNDDEISDTESVIEVPSTSTNDYRSQVVEINSDSDSDDSDSSSDVEYLNEIRKTIEKRIEVDEEEEEEEDDDIEESVGKKKHKPKLKVKGEMLLEDLPPIQDLQITVPENECIEFGKIHSIVDQLVLVSALPNAILLDLETVIFLEKGQKVLGAVFDVLGQVADPMYCVRFNSNKQIHDKEINVGDVVYVAPKTQYTQYVILSSLMRIKGSDASWENDIEPPPRFLDYSDDEQEQVAKRQLRNKNRQIDNDDPHKRPRTSEAEEENTTSNRSSSYNPHQRNSFSQQRDGNRRGGGGNYNSYSRPQYNNPNTNQRQQQQQHQQQQQPNYHRNSWHSNYYPQQYQAPPPNYGYGPNNGPSSQNRQQPPQAYPSQAPPMYAMPPMHAIPFPPNYAPHGGPHMPPHQLVPNTFNIGPPTLHGAAPHQQQQYTSAPPPPGAQ